MTLRRALFVPLFVVFLAACGGGDESIAGGVASATDLDESPEDAVELATETANEGAAEVSAEDAGLALAACMRDSGFEDFPDPTIDADGNLNLQEALANTDLNFRDEGFREQITTCGEEAGAQNFGAGARRNQAEGIQELLLGYTQCLRDEGVDVGDLGAPGGNGNGQGQAADGDGQGRARGEGGAGQDRSARIAQALGLDPEDPDTSAALTACEDTLAEAFAGVGGGQPPAATDNT